MLKPIAFSAFVALSTAVWILVPPAAGQSGPVYISAVDLDIVPAEFDKFIEAVKETGTASVKEPGCRRYDILVSARDPHHVLLLEVYDNVDALEVHRATEAFKKYQATTAHMVAKREVRSFSAIAMNAK